MILSPGCYIDCSHLSAADLNMRVIEFAESLGWTDCYNTVQNVKSDWHNYILGNVPLDWKGDEDDFFIDYRDRLDYLCEDAINWLNDDSFGPDNVYWTVDDNSLYLWEESNEDL